MKTLILCHKSKADAGAFEQVLIERGHDIDMRLAFNEGITDTDPLEHDLTIFMGGPMGAYQADIFPYLNDEINYIEKRLAKDKPYLGICLGAQLMAKALGSNVFPGVSGKEIGWHSIQVNEAGMQTPVKHLDDSKTSMMQWHGDTFDKPKDAVLLASSDMYKNQAVSYGQNALGVQFHPEVNESNIELWLAVGQNELQQAGLNVPLLRQQTLENLPTMREQRNKFFNEWLDQVLEA